MYLFIVSLCNQLVIFRFFYFLIIFVFTEEVEPEQKMASFVQVLANI